MTTFFLYPLTVVDINETANLMSRHSLRMEKR
jgi:hypothetical protein